MRPHRNTAPLPFLDDAGIGLPDQGTQPGEQRAAPVAEFRDPRVDPLRSCYPELNKR
jgi:hypothetical protein